MQNAHKLYDLISSRYPVSYVIIPADSIDPTQEVLFIKELRVVGLCMDFCFVFCAGTWNL